MKVIIMLSCLLVASAADTESREEPVYLCGRQLAEARLLLCYGEKNNRKRTSPGSLLEIFGDEDNRIEDWPWKGRRGFLSAAWQRYKRFGIVDECCLKPCTSDIIRNYC